MINFDCIDPSKIKTYRKKSTFRVVKYENGMEDGFIDISPSEMIPEDVLKSLFIPNDKPINLPFLIRDGRQLLLTDNSYIVESKYKTGNKYTVIHANEFNNIYEEVK